MLRSLLRKLPLLLACAALAAFPAIAETGAEKKPAPARTSPAAKAKNSPEAERAQKSRGVTVLIENWTPPLDPSDFPRGVTVLVERDHPPTAGPVVRVETPAQPVGPQESAEEQEPRPEARRDLLADPAAEIEEKQRSPPTAGPDLEQQIEAFGRPPRRGGSPLPEISGWVPESAYGEIDTSVPYPWNPAQFSTPAFDPEWEPRSDYEEREASKTYPWQPAAFARWIIDPEWRPSDAWNRQLGPPATWLTLAPSRGARHDLEAFSEASAESAEKDGAAESAEGSGDGGLPVSAAAGSESRWRSPWTDTRGARSWYARRAARRLS